MVKIFISIFFSLIVIMFKKNESVDMIFLIDVEKFGQLRNLVVRKSSFLLLNIF